MASELTRRLGVAVVGIPTVIAALYFGGLVLAVPVAVLAALGAQEVFSMAGHKEVRAFRGPGMVTAALLVLGASALGTFTEAAPLLLSLLGFLTVLCLVLFLGRRRADEAPLTSVAVTLFGCVYAGLSLAFVPLLHQAPAALGWVGEGSAWAGTAIVALPLASTWVGDSAAYFAGSAWGRGGRRLAPTISPNKSWIGSAFGILGAGVAAGIWFVVARPALPTAPAPPLGMVVAAGMLLGVAAQVGDLAESLLKREAGVKDSGTLFPGHGGVLDRLDALVFTLPLAFFLVLAWQVTA